MTQITYIKSSLRHSSALTAPEVAISQFGLWKSIKRAFKKYAKPLAAIVGIAASIAVPFIAPAVAGMIFGGTALGAGAIGAAIAGAGMGAAAGALTAYGTGQNVLTGALLGGLGGGLGGGISGFAGSGGSFLGSTADAVYGSGMAASALSGPGAGGLLASALPGTAGTAAPGVAGAAGTAGTTATASTGIGARLLEATINAAPGAISTVASLVLPSDVPTATAELKAEMDRLQNSDVEGYNRAKMLYDQLFARLQGIDSTAAAQLAEANVQAKTAGLIADVKTARGAASADYANEAEKRRLGVAASQEASGAFTDAYYRSEDAKNAGYTTLAGLNPRYSSSTMQYLQNQQTRALQDQADTAAGIGEVLSPYALALAPRDTTLTSAEADRLRGEDEKSRRRIIDPNYATA